MKVTLGYIVLNEAQYIALNLEQHYPFADRIVIVEGADRLYPRDRVSKDGLSIDDTAEIINSFPDPESKIKFIQHGFCEKTGPQAKSELRNRYLEKAHDGLLIAIDADEFYRRRELEGMIARCRKRPSITSWQYPQVHFWKNTSQFITGGYYNVPHTRFWIVKAGDRYQENHNVPNRNGRPLDRFSYKRFHRVVHQSGAGYTVQEPCCYHFGFCKPDAEIKAKNDYYIRRGERKTRPQTTLDRAVWFKEEIPENLQVLPYIGPLPEVFEELAHKNSPHPALSLASLQSRG